MTRGHPKSVTVNSQPDRSGATAAARLRGTAVTLAAAERSSGRRSCARCRGRCGHCSVRLARCGLLQHPIFRKPTFTPQLHVLAGHPDLIAAAAVAPIGEAELAVLRFPGAFTSGAHFE